MAGWINYTGSGIGTGRGGGDGGRDFPPRRFSSDTSSSVGGSSGGGGGGNRWRSWVWPPPQPHNRYRPVDAAHRHSSPSVLTEQETSSTSTSTSTHHVQMTHPPGATDKSPSSGTLALASSNKEPDDMARRSAANFECNVCFDMAEEPVVTKCGHLFCWECLYQWLHVHSRARECPVCKGEVAEDAIIPIYGRGGSGVSLRNAPPRPTGARVESSRQQHYQLPHEMVDVDGEEYAYPFDYPSMLDYGYERATSITSYMSPYPDAQYDASYVYYEWRPEVYDDYMMGFPVFASARTEAGSPSSSHMHINLSDRVIPVHHGEYQCYGYGPIQFRNPGQHGHRHSARASGDQSSTDAMVAGGSNGTYYGDNSANSNGSVVAPSRPNLGWVERRGRSNRNSYSGGGRGMHDGRRYYN